MSEPLEPALLAIIEALAEAQARRDYAEMRAAGPVVARLRRALQLTGQEAADAEVIQTLVTAFMDYLPIEKALSLERRIGCLADAAEELGPAATAQQIVERANQLERRLL